MKEKMSHTMISLDGRNSKLPDHKIYKMMRHALFIAKENRACHSRQIGSVICDEDCKILSVGYNGPPKNTPHTDTLEYYNGYLNEILSQSEKDDLLEYQVCFGKEGYKCYGQCPRKVLGYKSGQRSEICSCLHSEANCITNAPGSVKNGFLFCSCPDLSCINCTSTIIQVGIKEVHFMDGGEYHKGALWLYEKANIPVFRHKVEEVKNG